MAKKRKRVKRARWTNADDRILKTHSKKSELRW